MPQTPLEARAFDRRLFHYTLLCVPKLKNHATPLIRIGLRHFDRHFLQQTEN